MSKAVQGSWIQLLVLPLAFSVGCWPLFLLLTLGEKRDVAHPCRTRASLPFTRMPRCCCTTDTFWSKIHVTELWEAPCSSWLLMVKQLHHSTEDEAGQMFSFIARDQKAQCLQWAHKQDECIWYLPWALSQPLISALGISWPQRAYSVICSGSLFRRLLHSQVLHPPQHPASCCMGWLLPAEPSAGLLLLLGPLAAGETHWWSCVSLPGAVSFAKITPGKHLSQASVLRGVQTWLILMCNTRAFKHFHKLVPRSPFPCKMSARPMAAAWLLPEV